MKRALLLPILLFSIFINFQNTYAQCSPDLGCTDPEGDGEYCPSEFPNAVEAEYYEEVLTIIAPTEVAGITIHHIDVLGIDNIPPGMSFECQNNDCSFWPGVAKCMNISGTPEIGSWGDYKLYITIEAFMDLAGMPISMGETTDSSFSVTIEPHLHADFEIVDMIAGPLCYYRPYQIVYTGNAGADATYNWTFGENATVSGEGQGPYEIIYYMYYIGPDSISLEVLEEEFISPVNVVHYQVDICEGTSEIENTPYTISPNPFSNSLSISNINVDSYISIYDISGKTIYKMRHSGDASEEINLSALENGIYILSIQNSSNIYTTKIIKQ